MYQHAATDADLCAAPSMAAACRGLHVRYWEKTTRILGMSGAFDSNVWETSCMVSTRRIERHQFRCAHGPHVECISRCTPSSRRRQCSADGSKLHAGSERAVPKTRPRIGPKSDPLDGSTDSVWNHCGGQIWGSIGGLFLSFAGGQLHSIVATPSMLGSIGPVRKHPAANRPHRAMALQCCGHMWQRELHDQRARNPSTLVVGVGGVGWGGAGWVEWDEVGMGWDGWSEWGGVGWLGWMG